MEMGGLSITQDFLVSALLQSEDEIIYGIQALHTSSCHHDGDDYTDLKIWASFFSKGMIPEKQSNGHHSSDGIEIWQTH